MRSAPRSRTQRRHDTERRFREDVDCWVATASDDGIPYLIPLSFDWDGTAFLLATPAESATGRNLGRHPGVRLAFGPTRDVTIVDGDVEILEMPALPGDQADRFVTRTGFDPRTESARYCWYRVTPQAIQAWREANELAGRTLMRDGRWRE